MADDITLKWVRVNVKVNLPIPIPTLVTTNHLTFKRFVLVLAATITAFYRSHPQWAEKFDLTPYVTIVLIFLLVCEPIRVEGFFLGFLVKGSIEYLNLLWTANVSFLLTTDKAKGLIDVPGLLAAALVSCYSLLLSGLISPGVDFSLPMVCLQICLHIGYAIEKETPPTQHTVLFVSLYAAIIVFSRAWMEYQKERNRHSTNTVNDGTNIGVIPETGNSTNSVNDGTNGVIPETGNAKNPWLNKFTKEEKGKERKEKMSEGTEGKKNTVTKIADYGQKTRSSIGKQAPAVEPTLRKDTYGQVNLQIQTGPRFIGV